MEAAAPITRFLVKFTLLVPLLRWVVGQRMWAVTALTWKAAFRFRLFWVMAALLLASVVVLPVLIKDDGSARGFIQITLTYTLSVITGLLGFATLWLACGTLARDIEDSSIQMVAVKPIPRWQIWLGKWLGILLLNASLLSLAGGTVYGLLHWRTARMERALAQARQAKDVAAAAHLESQLGILRDEIFVARASLKEPPPDIEAEVVGLLRKVPNAESMSAEQLQETRGQLRERVKTVQQVVPPGHRREWKFDLGLRRHLLKDQPLFLRIKFHAAQTNATGTYLGLWQVGPFDSPKSRSLPQSLAAGTFHEISVPPNLFQDDGQLIVNFVNRNESALIFPLEDGMEVLYREGGFGLNFMRGLGIILCWLALLATLGLASASLLSFPVAAFFSISLLVVALSSGTLANVVQEGTVTGLDHETGVGQAGWIDFVLLPLFRAILGVVGLVQSFTPVDSLSTGRSITWGQLGQAFGQVVLLLGGLIALTGIALFSRRELATAQGHS